MYYCSIAPAPHQEKSTFMNIHLFNIHSCRFCLTSHSTCSNAPILLIYNQSFLLTPIQPHASRAHSWNTYISLQCRFSIYVYIASAGIEHRADPRKAEQYRALSNNRHGDRFFSCLSGAAHEITQSRSTAATTTSPAP